MMHAKLKFRCFVVFAAFAGLTGWSDDIWTGAVDGDWEKPSNWKNGAGTGNLTFTAADLVTSVITFGSEGLVSSGSLSFANGLETPVVFSGPYGLACSNDVKIAGTDDSSSAFALSGGSLTVENKKSLTIAAGMRSSGRAIVSNATLYADWGLTVSSGSASTGTLVVTNGARVSTGRALDFGSGENSVADVSVADAELSVGNRETFFGRGAGSQTSFTLCEAGTFSSRADLDLYYADGSTVDFLVKTGGVFAFKRVDHAGNGTGTVSLTLDGGTLRPTGDAADWLTAASGLSVNLTARDGIVDTDAYNVTAAVTITGDGGLVKTGSGALTLATQPTFSGATVLRDGTLQLANGVTLPNGVIFENGALAFEGTAYPARVIVPAGGQFVYNEAYTYPEGIELRDGATLLWDLSGAELGVTTTLTAVVTIPAGRSLVDFVAVSSGSRRVATLGTDPSGNVTAVLAEVDDETPVVTRWTGYAGDSRWTTDANWTCGAPKSNDTAVVAVAATILSEQTPTKVFSCLRIAADVTLKATDTWSQEFVFSPAAIEGSGKLTLYRARLVPRAALTIPAGITLESRSDAAKRTVTLDGRADARITILGDVVVPADADGKNNMKLNYCDVVGNIRVDGITTGEGDLGTSATMLMYGTLSSGSKITGSGHFLYEASTIAGDFSEFTGAVCHNYTRDCTLAGPIDARRAKWILGQTTYFDVSNGSLFQFGWVSNNNPRVFFPYSTETVEIEVGARNEDMVLGEGVYAQAREGNHELSNFTIRKVGSGTLTTSLYGLANWEVADGELRFEEIPESITSLNGYSRKYINTIRVTGDGFVTGVLRSDAVTEVKKVIYEGARIPLAAARTDGALSVVPVHPLYTNGVTSVEIASAELAIADETSRTVLADGQPGEQVRILHNAHTIGSITPAQLVVTTKKTDATQPEKVWQTSVLDNSVFLKFRDLRLGFVIRFR